MLAVGGMWALIRTIHRLCPISHGSRYTERHITTTKVHRSGDERRSCRAKTREEDGRGERKRNWPRGTRGRQQSRAITTPRLNFSSLSLSSWYMLKYSTALLPYPLAPCRKLSRTMPVFFRPPVSISFSLFLSLVPLFQHVEKCRALRFARRRY